MPAGLTNLGNTCYMNATVQCLKTVPELREALQNYQGSVATSNTSSAQSITAALRDLYASMDKGSTVPPLIMLRVLHMAFPRFAETSEHGGFTQQVCFGFKFLLEKQTFYFFFTRMQMSVGQKWLGCCSKSCLRKKPTACPKKKNLSRSSTNTLESRSMSNTSVQKLMMNHPRKAKSNTYS